MCECMLVFGTVHLFGGGSHPGLQSTAGSSAQRQSHWIFLCVKPMCSTDEAVKEILLQSPISWISWSRVGGTCRVQRNDFKTKKVNTRNIDLWLVNNFFLQFTVRLFISSTYLYGPQQQNSHVWLWKIFGPTGITIAVSVFSCWVIYRGSRKWVLVLLIMALICIILSVALRN